MRHSCASQRRTVKAVAQTEEVVHDDGTVRENFNAGAQRCLNVVAAHWRRATDNTGRGKRDGFQQHVEHKIAKDARVLTQR